MAGCVAASNDQMKTLRDTARQCDQCAKTTDNSQPGQQDNRRHTYTHTYRQTDTETYTDTQGDRDRETMLHSARSCKLCTRSQQLSYLASPLPVFPLEFRGEINHEEIRVMGLLGGESCMILTSSVLTDPPV